MAKNKTIINSTTADKEKLDKLVPLAKEYSSKLIGLTISQKGIPQNKDQRVELAIAQFSSAGSRKQLARFLSRQCKEGYLTLVPSFS